MLHCLTKHSYYKSLTESSNMDKEILLFPFVLQSLWKSCFYCACYISEKAMHLLVLLSQECLMSYILCNSVCFLMEEHWFLLGLHVKICDHIPVVRWEVEAAEKAKPGQAKLCSRKAAWSILI